jgi:hypothetical protein
LPLPEAISPHNIAPVICHPVEPFARTAVCFIGAATIAGSAMKSRRRQKPEPLGSFMAGT